MELEDFKLITSSEYLELDNAIFVGQTRVDEDNIYFMCWESKGILYKTKHKL